MVERDESYYEKLKFKAGLEIHQQLDTKKLFCNCPSVLRKDEPDFEISRRLHAVAGEGGDIDIAAQHQVSKNKEFIDNEIEKRKEKREILFGDFIEKIKKDE